MLLIGSICLVVFTSCSTQKNTRGTRFYHALTTKYNIYFNGNNAFEEGLQAIDKAAKDDYSHVIPLYPISNHEAASAATSQMDLTIEKCRKCIKLHSIKEKPKPDPSRRNDPKYKIFMQQEEYNKEMHKAWLLLAKAEFHKADFVGAIGTFNYIINHYQTNPDVVAQCQLWIVRAYAELGWFYEAEELISKVKQDDLNRKHASLYASTIADLHLKQKQYADAISFVKLALPDQRRPDKARYTYVLGQINELQQNKQGAIDLYKRVKKMNPSADMDFNARLRMQLLAGNVKKLQKMARQPKYKERQDYIYGAIGDIYLNKKDTISALENYELAVENSTEGGAQKASILVRAADLYYEKHRYQDAGRCYSQAVDLLSSTDENYSRIRLLSETLDELATEYNTVVLQDSLKRLSTLSEEEQMKIVQKIIADLEKAEKEEQEKAIQAEREARNSGFQSVNTSNMLGGRQGSGEWYFYNQQLVRNGKQEFQKRWGNRSLEDNWRRMIKTNAPAFAQNEDEQGADSISLAQDSTQSSVITDNKNPQYYLQQIPKTPEELAASDMLIADALYNMIYIYQDKLHDEEAAQETFEDFVRRFPQDQRVAEVYYGQYLSALKHSDNLTAGKVRQIILTDYPQSDYAKIVSDPNYFDKLKKMQYEQDSVYQATYNAYKAHEYNKVKANKVYAEENFPLSKHIPRFLFLNAVAVAKTENQDAFVASLKDLVARYPESPMGSMAKDMLALMNQGEESQKGDSNSSLLDKRQDIQQQEDTVSTEKQFSSERKQSAYVLIVINQNEQDLNDLLFQVALFNFSQFLIKDFDLKQVPMFTLSKSALQISGMDSYDEALWYKNTILANTELSALFKKLDAQIVCITDENLTLLNQGYTLEQYRVFQQENHLE